MTKNPKQTKLIDWIKQTNLSVFYEKYHNLVDLVTISHTFLVPGDCIDLKPAVICCLLYKIVILAISFHLSPIRLYGNSEYDLKARR